MAFVHWIMFRCGTLLSLSSDYTTSCTEQRAKSSEKKNIYKIIACMRTAVALKILIDSTKANHLHIVLFINIFPSLYVLEDSSRIEGLFIHFVFFCCYPNFMCNLCLATALASPCETHFHDKWNIFTGPELYHFVWPYLSSANDTVKQTAKLFLYFAGLIGLKFQKTTHLWEI